MRERLYLVHGMQRSGNHAIINWMIAQRKMVFFNNIYPIKHVLERRIEIRENREYRSWYEAELHRKYGGIIGAIKRPFKRRYPTLVSLEDHRLDLQPFSHPPAERWNVLILRDPRNLFASRIHRAWKVEHPAYPREMNDQMIRVIETWKEHAREFLGDTSVLSRRVGIYFNLWFNNENYRREVSARLELPFSDRGKEEVTAYGGGSSFDGKSFHGKSDEMKVLERYQMLSGKEKELFEKVMEDKELQELSQRLSRYEMSFSDEFGV